MPSHESVITRSDFDIRVGPPGLRRFVRLRSENGIADGVLEHTNDPVTEPWEHIPPDCIPHARRALGLKN